MSTGFQARLLTFEVDGSMYGISIAGVLEVIEAERVTCVPTLSKQTAGVMNWHGDALPLVAPSLLFEGHDDRTDACEDASTEALVRGQVLVVSPGDDASARLGIPIDRVLGVVDGALPPARAQHLVLERRPLDGRVLSVLDPRLLLVKAAEVIEREVGSSGIGAQGETR